MDRVLTATATAAAKTLYYEDLEAYGEMWDILDEYRPGGPEPEQDCREFWQVLEKKRGAYARSRINLGSLLHSCEETLSLLTASPV